VVRLVLFQGKPVWESNVWAKLFRR